MKLVPLLLSTLFSSCASTASCLYGVTDCGPNNSCVKISQKEADCRAYSSNLPEVLFPMSSSPEVYCDQGNLAPNGSSHAFNNTSFSLDLMTNRNLPAATIKAGVGGQVIAYNKCVKKNDECGNGFGNHVLILNDDGYLFFYAHLEKVLVKTGELIKKGQNLGIEGNTGWTGENNRHLHFSVHYSWKKLGLDYLKTNVGHLPDSVPFKINVCQPNYSDCKIKFTDSRDLKCTRTTNKVEWLKVL